ncbi:MAG: sigma-54 dependent transcriptional regulator [Desulfobacteraceae bacterium]|nr:sigma-54 dependent transcriptional regulator [Desulfobacteraceae bacterium]
MGISGAASLGQSRFFTRKKVLIVDDDPLITIGLERTVAKEGFLTAAATTGNKALQKIEEDPPDIVLLDIKLPDSLDGLALLEIIKQTRPEITVIMISGQAEIRSAVDAMKAGASDYLEKPIDFNRLKAILEPLKAGRPDPRPPAGTDLVFVSDRMKRAVEIMQRLALKSDITVLVLGESGTGKNYLCRRMHELSPRKDFSYVQIGCANIPDHLIESELFGYEKGAFTDAKQSKKGLVEVAEGGTLLLDELGEMPYQFQAKVLALLEEKRYRKVGALQDSIADIRILAATNRNLHTLVQEKRFRLDLYYRLNVATIELPALRERPEDIPPLVRHFLSMFSSKYGLPVKILEEGGLRLLREYHWPGNIRQLKNMLERLVVLTEGEVISTEEISASLMLQPQDRAEAGAGPAGPDVPGSLALGDMEERYIRSALKLAAGNQRRAAELLHISRDTLRYRLKKMGIEAK